MNRTSLLVLLLAVVVVLFASLFRVDQTEFVIEIRLGDPHRVISEPGLYLRVPFITEIHPLDKRLLTYDSSPGSIITRDKKTMLVDNFAKWRVSDPLLFYRSVRSVNGAQSRLDDIIYSQLRQTLGKHDLEEIINERAGMMNQVTEQTRTEASKYGVHVVDVLIKRADLPQENSRAVYDRMDAERRRVAKRYLSEGEEEALKIRSGADRDKVTLISLALRESAQLRGEGDAEAARIYAAAYEKDPEFYRFIRSQEAYRKVFNGKSTLIFSTAEMPFLQYLK